MRLLLIIFIFFFPIYQCSAEIIGARIAQLTFAHKNHILGVFKAWSPDDEWIVYCCGPNHLNTTIEKVNASSRQIVRLYKISNQTEYGPGCGTPSYCDSCKKVVFIHGPINANAERKYEFWRRSGVVIEEPNYNEPIFIDARDVTYPFTPGASRGGTHCHEFSYDGNWISFTYNDMLMAELEKEMGIVSDLRTIGVSKKSVEVSVDKDTNGENFDGQWYTVLLVDVVSNPCPGSDEISRAYENCWVGRHGYKNDDGKLQRAIAFKGKTVSENGDIVSEVYIVDVPNEIDKASLRPLEGTKTQMPAPPKGARWRRLTHTDNWKYPGLSAEPRCWLSSTFQGDKIFFIAHDENGINQVYYVRPLCGEVIKVTSSEKGIASTVNVSSDDKRICYVSDSSIFITEIDSGCTVKIVDKDFAPSKPMWSHDGKKIVFNSKVVDGKKTYMQIFVAMLTNH